MDERRKFVAKLLDGEKMAVVCREFGISRKTGYKIFNRDKEVGLEGLNDRSRRPQRHANQLPFQVERQILAIKREHPSWGTPKIREKLIRAYPQIKPPAKSTIHALLDRNGLVKRRKHRRYKAKGTALRDAQRVNDLWCADYKDEFMLCNWKYFYSLTITDYHSRYLLTCDGLEPTKEPFALTVFERTFKVFGLPNAMTTDNCLPLSSPNAMFGISRLSMWWLRLGIDIERIKPGYPQQSGRHERMHLTLKKEATKPPTFKFLQQQSRFDDFIEGFNHDRPHQALNMKYPGERYTRSARIYRVPEEPEYPLHDRTIQVTHCGRICIGRRKINLSRVFAGQKVGVRGVADKIWLLSIVDFDLGFFDQDEARVEPAENPLIPKVVTAQSSIGTSSV